MVLEVLHGKKKALWRLVVAGIYREESLGWLASLPIGSSKNRPWFDIVKMAPLYERFIKFKAGKGQRISFWKDKWQGVSSLKEDFPDIFSLSLKQNAMVAECCDEVQGTWNLGIRRGVFEREV